MTWTFAIFFEPLNESIVDLIVDKDPRCCRADLAHVAHYTVMCPLDCIGDLSVIEDDESTLPSCLKRDVFHRIAGHPHDLFTCRCTASEGHLIDFRMLDQG